MFSPKAAGRLFGLLGAGATLGQLVGSLGAGALARAPLLGGGSAPSLLPLLASACMLELAGQAVGRFRLAPRRSSSPIPAGSTDDVEEAGTVAGSASLAASISPSKADKAAPRAVVAGAGGSSSSSRSSSVVQQLLGRTLEGYRLIRWVGAGGCMVDMNW